MKKPTGKRLRRVVVTLIVLAVLGYAFIFPHFYWGDAIEARVVDADTEQPLEGVIVVAKYELFYPSIGGLGAPNVFHVMEAVTDHNGRFHLPAWGPKWVPGPFYFLFPIHIGPIMRQESPCLILFKEGYDFDVLSNYEGGRDDIYYRRYSAWNSKTVALRRFKGDLRAYANRLSNIDYALGIAYRDRYKQCLWKAMPRTVITLDRFAKTLTQNKLYNLDMQFERIENLPHQAECGDAAEYFKQYQP